MKIAFFDYPVTLAEPPKSGGIRLVSYALALRLARAGHEVLFYGSKGSYQELEYYEDGIIYRRIPDSWFDKILEPLNYLDTWNISHPQRPFYASQLFFCDFYRQVAQDIQAQQCDVIHMNIVFQFVPLIRAYNPQAKIVLHIHSDFLPLFDPVIVKKHLKSVDLVIGCSNYLTNQVRKYLPHINSQTIYNGADIHHFTVPNDHENKQAQKKDSKQILFVGRISPEKGVHVLIDAFNKVISRYPQVQLKLVGSENALVPWYTLDRQDPQIQNLRPYYQGSYRSQLQDRIAPTAASSVFFLGKIPHLELISYYQQADIFIFPSVWNEAFGMPIVEAMSMGLPVIATRGGAFPELVEDEKTGLLVQRGDADALAAAILRLLLDDNLTIAMGEAGKHRAVEKFAWDDQAEKLLHQYHRILDFRF
ncbi:glycosyltransferase family 4 protein [Nodularia sphaerocarpa]|uniref:glycosyltransferase family 4 protein n=1 Tax=Nodularia sphaerocarpa TaxID=137816 RepID=UPI001EFAD7B4|nr:glycosyltransferase family 4 protein [Nodularia sphaerocarpa]MDB9373572.1 glycosyltransferase family 4 protein [Nodularia sphaerocarpa CS-585]MDB9379469.1 glycosyltransferase family 4 protein [Nodularia sphaerocarpa CS-585A2]ULP74360.1 putative glycosyltransferase [Nodularia sphaerocarpa UHCC 0038]